jgi:hypothetical protein
MGDWTTTGFGLWEDLRENVVRNYCTGRAGKESRAAVLEALRTVPRTRDLVVTELARTEQRLADLTALLMGV